MSKKPLLDSEERTSRVWHGWSVVSVTKRDGYNEKEILNWLMSAVVSLPAEKFLQMVLSTRFDLREGR